MNYFEIKKEIDKIRRRDEMLFRMSIVHLMDVGIRNLTDENVEETCKEIMTRDDTHSFMTNEYQCELVKTAQKLSKFDPTNLLVYISREIEYDVGQGMTFKRLSEIIRNIMCETSCCYSEEEQYEVFSECCEISDEELIELGYGCLIPKNKINEEE